LSTRTVGIRISWQPLWRVVFWAGVSFAIVMALVYSVSKFSQYGEVLERQRFEYVSLIAWRPVVVLVSVGLTISLMLLKKGKESLIPWAFRRFSNSELSSYHVRNELTHPTWFVAMFSLLFGIFALGSFAIGKIPMNVVPQDGFLTVFSSTHHSVRQEEITVPRGEIISVPVPSRYMSWAHSYDIQTDEGVVRVAVSFRFHLEESQYNALLMGHAQELGIGESTTTVWLRPVSGYSYRGGAQAIFRQEYFRTAGFEAFFAPKIERLIREVESDPLRVTQTGLLVRLSQIIEEDMQSLPLWVDDTSFSLLGARIVNWSSSSTD